MNVPPHSMRFGLFLVLTLACIGVLRGQWDTLSRGVAPANPTITGHESPGRYLYFIIGIDQYEHWFTLRNAVADARGVERLLAEAFGFRAAHPTLLDREASKANILKAMDRLYHELRPDDNLFIFFAGHGHTRTDTIGTEIVETGFLIPQDGRGLENDEWLSYLDLDHLLDRAALLPARHITVVLDACHSGLALSDHTTSYRGIQELGPELTGNISRQVISSARHDQLAQDTGPVPDHSLFTGLLLEALASGRCDLNDDLFITTSELALYLEQEVNAFSAGLQTPDFGAFSFDQRGELVLALEDDAPEMLWQRADAQLLRGELEAFFETIDRLEQKAPPLPAYFRLRYRAALLDGDGGRALATLQRMLTDHREDINPRVAFEISRLLPKVRFWQEAFSQPLPERHTLEAKIVQQGKEATMRVTDRGVFTVSLDSDKPYTIELTNVSDRPYHLYALYVDGYEVEVMQLDVDQHEPLRPGQRWVSPAYENLIDISYQQFHLLFSPEPLEVFLHPPDHLLTQILAPWAAPPEVYSAVVFMHFK